MKFIIRWRDQKIRKLKVQTRLNLFMTWRDQKTSEA